MRKLEVNYRPSIVRALLDYGEQIMQEEDIFNLLYMLYGLLQKNPDAIRVHIFNQEPCTIKMREKFHNHNYLILSLSKSNNVSLKTQTVADFAAFSLDLLQNWAACRHSTRPDNAAGELKWNCNLP